MHSHFALVNSYTNSAGEFVSERLVPEPNFIDINDIPPPPPGSPPRTFVPSDAGDSTPEYLAYVPIDADPEFANPEFDQAIPSEKSDVCETCGHTKKRVHKIEAKWLKMSYEKAS